MDVAQFQKIVWDFYRKHRRDFPWRPPSLKLRKDNTLDPWKILVSEVMLQQTQAARIVAFYKKFVKRFPTPRSLALARLSEVLRLWSGLGYNRRALHLQRAAEIIVREHGGQVPHSLEKLDALPGIGANTAAAILAYAWNEPVVFVETNIRTVFLHFFFKNRKKVRDAAILEFVEQTLPKKSSLQPPPFLKEGADGEDLIRQWYAGLMDYGAHLKKKLGNPNARSAHYTKQGTFTGSVRQMRGAILRRALAGTLRARDFPANILAALVHEGFLQRRGKKYEI